MSTTILRKQNEWMFYWVIVSEKGRIIAQSPTTYRTKAEALSMALGHVIAGKDVVDESDTPIPRPSQSDNLDAFE